jgi:FAD:protein FMN transferase
VKKRAPFKHFVLVLFLLQLAPSLSGAAAEMLRLEANADAMGSTCSIVLYDEDRNKMEFAADDALEEARRLDRLLSNYRPESEWSKVNLEAADRPVEVSRELFDLLTKCVEYSRNSDGTFDITVGPLMKIRGFYKGSGHVPQPGEIERATRQRGYRDIVLDASKQTVFFARAGLNLDPGGVGKGGQNG